MANRAFYRILLYRLVACCTLEPFQKQTKRPHVPIEYHPHTRRKNLDLWNGHPDTLSLSPLPTTQEPQETRSVGITTVEWMEGPISPYEFGNKAGLDSIHDFGSGRGYVKLIYRGTNVFHSSYGAAFLKMVNKLPHRDFGGMQFLPS